MYKKRDWMEALAKGPPASLKRSDVRRDAVHTLKSSKINQSQPKAGQIVLVASSSTALNIHVNQEGALGATLYITNSGIAPPFFLDSV